MILIPFLLGLSLPGVSEVVISIAAFLTACAGIYRLAYVPLKKHFNRVNAGMDTLLGYPAVTDPGTGREIQGATPPLAARVYDLEDTNKKMAEALTVIAGNQHDIVRMQQDLEERKKAGDAIVHEFTQWRLTVDTALRDWVAEQDQLSKVVRHELEAEVRKPV